MCGIAGIVGQSPNQALEKMLEATKHRGPDNTGVFHGENLSLGMNRLAIIDTSSFGNQPMISDDGRFVLVFNGEFYDFKEQKAKLVKEGVFFKSHSDTEVVLQLYIKYGEDCLDYMNGMFAFVVWDNHEKKLFGARDHFGIKPLLYTIKNNTFIFCSELKGMIASGMVSKTISHDAVHQFFTIGSIVPPLTIYEEVSSLRPGYKFTYRNNNFVEKPYWSLSEIKPLTSSDLSYGEAKSKVRDLVLRSVEEQLVSDVPLGVFLSGGLDSTIITAGMKELGTERIESFSIGFDGAGNYIDESNEAKLSADFYNTKHHRIIITGKFAADNIQDFIVGLDQPSLDGLNTYFVSKFARKNVTVALSGLGGDELFFGYTNLLAQLKANASANFEKVLFPLNHLFLDKMNSKTASKIALQISKGNPLSYYLRSLSNSNVLDINPYFRPSYKSANNFQQEFFEFVSENYKFSPHIQNHARQLFLNFYMGAMLLRDSDAVAMKSSLEVRFPFLSKTLAEFLFQVPQIYMVKDDFKINGRYYGNNNLKMLLTDAFRADLPPGFFDRKKTGFSLPYKAWMKNELCPMVSDAFKSDNSVFDSKHLNVLHEKWHKDAADWKLIWKIFVLNSWLKTNN